MKLLENKWLHRCILMMGMMILMTGNQKMVQAMDSVITSKDVTLTIHEYDWTSYSQDTANPQQTVTTGERNTTAEAGYQKYALEYVELTIIKISDRWTATDLEGGQISSEPVYKLTEEWKENLFSGNKEMLGKEYYSAAELVSALNERKNEIESKVALAGHMEGERKAETDSEGKAVFNIEPKDQGLYLVVESRVPENVEVTTPPFLLSLPMVNAEHNGWNYDVHVYPKNQTRIPTVKKLVKNGEEEFKDSTSASSGDEVDYNLVANIPNATTDATKFKQFDFEDSLPVGVECEMITGADGKLTVNPAKVSVRIYKNNTAAEQNNSSDYEELVFGADYTIEYTMVQNGNSKMFIHLTENGLKKLNAHANGNEYLSVVYTAKVGDVDDLQLGDNGNHSEVSLFYGRTSTVNKEGTVLSYQDIKDAAIVYIYGFEIQKTFDVKLSNQELVENVQFIVYNKTKNKYMTGKHQTEEGTDQVKSGYYKITGTVDTKEEATTFSPNSNGELVIDGVSAEEYNIIETKTVEGYILLKEPIDIQIFAKEVNTRPTTATLAGQVSNDNVVISDVYGKEKATAKVDGKDAVVTDAGRVPRVKLTILNVKSTLASTIADGLSDVLPGMGGNSSDDRPSGGGSSSGTSANSPQTGDSTVVWPYICMAILSILVIRKRVRHR